MQNFYKLINEVNITNISLDSRKVQLGDVFIAIKGFTYNGNDYIEDAFKAGAKLVISDEIVESPYGNVINVSDARQVLGELVTILYPNLPKYLLAVTGTNGKTSIVNYFQQIITLLGHKAASVGTLGINSPVSICDLPSSNLTTPNIVELRKILNSLSNVVDYVAIEVSSHAIAQKRIYNIPFKAAAFSSFSQDHLDYHDTMEDYLLTKLSLFKDNLSKDSKIILSKQVEFFSQVKENFKFMNNVITVGEGGRVNILHIDNSLYGQLVNFKYKNKIYNFNTNILGKFQIVNILIAGVLVESCGIEFDIIANTFQKLKGVVGRLDRVYNNKGFYIFIDYSHTPGALKNVLIELNSIKKHDGRIITLFGCGGERDIYKRKIMGQIARNFSDIVIITDDNPRNEDPNLIRQEILRGSSQNAIEIPDRYAAIKHAIENIRRNDILLISGKGHENYQEIGNDRLPFNDKEIVSNLLGMKI